MTFKESENDSKLQVGFYSIHPAYMQYEYIRVHVMYVRFPVLRIRTSEVSVVEFGYRKNVSFSFAV